MSFSEQLKNELKSSLPEKDHCMRASLISFQNPSLVLSDESILEKSCCKKNFLKGLFLSSGFISDPEKEYRLEISLDKKELSDAVIEILKSFSIVAKTVVRKEHFVVYLKEGDAIVDFLALMQASTAILELENIRVVKDVRNSINRRVNCETANMNKTVTASVKQVRAIEYLRDHIGFEALPKGLEAIARLRTMYPELSLVELGEMMDPPLGKSAVNHRLRKLKEIAEEEGYDK